MTCLIKFGIITNHTQSYLESQGTFYCLFYSFFLDKTFLHRLHQPRIALTITKLQVSTCIHSHCTTFEFLFMLVTLTKNSSDSPIVTNSYTIKGCAIAKIVSYYLGTCHHRHLLKAMIACHHTLIVCHSADSLMRKKNLLGQFLIAQLRSTTIAQEVLAASSHTLGHVLTLQTSNKANAHATRKITILSISFFQTIEGCCTNHIYHW